MIEIFFTAIALLLVMEGILPFAAPSLWRKLLLRMADRDEASIRKTGLITLISGVVIMCLVHSGLL